MSNWRSSHTLEYVSEDAFYKMQEAIDQLEQLYVGFSKELSPKFYTELESLKDSFKLLKDQVKTASNDLLAQEQVAPKEDEDGLH